VIFILLNKFIIVFPYGISSDGVPVIFTDNVLVGRFNTDKIGKMEIRISTG
jgi:hypothetical protein